MAIVKFTILLRKHTTCMLVMTFIDVVAPKRAVFEISVQMHGLLARSRSAQPSASG